jgi:hypothetical protein
VETVDHNENLSSRGLIASVVSDAQRLVALEIALAKQELKELATGNAIAAGIIVFGGLLTALASSGSSHGTGRPRPSGAPRTW